MRRFQLHKTVPLAISRGTTAQVSRLLLIYRRDGRTGLGETGGFETGHRRCDTDAVAAELEAQLPRLEGIDPLCPQTWEPRLRPLSPPARCGVDLALHDWWARGLGQPLWRLWGLDGGRDGPATSVTLGLGPVEGVLERLQRWWNQFPAGRIKLKLGSPDGPDHDRAVLAAVADALRRRSEHLGGRIDLQVDANGGWSHQTTRTLLPDLQRHGVTLLEQPLPADPDPERDRAGFAALHPHCPMPLVADESCWDLPDLLRLAPHVDAVNIKLLKSGGLREAALMARVARRLDLRLMLGCYSDSSLLNGAAAQLLPLVDWPDLDSHLNLRDDPFRGLPRRADRLRPPPGPGLGIVPTDTALASA